MQNTSERANLTPLRVHDGIILCPPRLAGWLEYSGNIPILTRTVFSRRYITLGVGRIDLGLVLARSLLL